MNNDTRIIGVVVGLLFVSSCFEDCGSCEDPLKDPCVCLDSCASDKADRTAYLDCLAGCNYEGQGACLELHFDASTYPDADLDFKDAAEDASEDAGKLRCPPEPCDDWCRSTCATADAAACFDECLPACKASC